MYCVLCIIKNLEIFVIIISTCKNIFQDSTHRYRICGVKKSSYNIGTSQNNTQLTVHILSSVGECCFNNSLLVIRYKLGP